VTGESGPSGRTRLTFVTADVIRRPDIDLPAIFQRKKKELN
jgi:hypothetical protein